MAGKGKPVGQFGKGSKDTYSCVYCHKKVRHASDGWMTTGVPKSYYCDSAPVTSSIFGKGRHLGRKDSE
jgi:hypothetical protein